jgi:hypothetical protein
MHCCLSYGWLLVMWLLIALQPLDVPPPFIAPSGYHVTSCCAVLWLPQLVVASPLVAPPQPLDAPAAATQCTVTSPHAGASTSHLPLVKNTPLAPSRLFFWMLGANG